MSALKRIADFLFFSTGSLSAIWMLYVLIWSQFSALPKFPLGLFLLVPFGATFVLAIAFASDPSTGNGLLYALIHLAFGLFEVTACLLLDASGVMPGNRVLLYMLARILYIVGCFWYLRARFEIGKPVEGREKPVISAV